MNYFLTFLIAVFVLILLYEVGKIIVMAWADWTTEQKDLSAEQAKINTAFNYAQFNLKSFSELVRDIQYVNAYNLENLEEKENYQYVVNGIRYVQEFIYPLLTQYSDDQHQYFMENGYEKEITTEEIKDVLYNTTTEGDLIAFDHDPESIFKEKRKNGYNS